HLRLAGLISGGGRTILNLLDCIDRGELDAELPLVIASRPCSGVRRLSDRGVNVRVVPYQDMPDVETYSAAINELLDSVGPDLVLMGGFLSFWWIPDRYQGRVMNIHPALLPCFGGKGLYGRRVHEAVLSAGCKVSGCTVHFASNEYDAGPIVVQRCVQIEESDTADSLAERVFQQERLAYPRAIRLFASDRLRIEGSVVRILGGDKKVNLD
ncbi:MAG: phosphoribosylglycinamide formyltransferase, partial [Planctomycetota bacterium]